MLQAGLPVKLPAGPARDWGEYNTDSSDIHHSKAHSRNCPAWHLEAFLHSHNPAVMWVYSHLLLGTRYVKDLETK